MKPTPKILPYFILTAVYFSLSACNQNDTEVTTETGGLNEIRNDTALREIINTHQLTGDALKDRIIPSIEAATAQLGMRLFFSKALGGDRDSACVTCHHPTLGGGDNLSLPIGVGAEIPNLLGIGRLHSSAAAHYDAGPSVPRNAPTTFNIAAWDEVLFHDGRVESLSKIPQENGVGALGIRTPDSAFATADSLSGTNLASAQARFPVTSPEEMKGFNHDDKNRQAIREFLASRIGGYAAGAGQLSDNNYWLSQFQAVFGQPAGTAETLITEQNIAFLLGEYERSQAFSNTAWRKYIEGDDKAISNNAKNGALLFFRSQAEGGANCASCHSGDLFSDEHHYNIAMPQIGRGKGDGSDGSADFGRFRESGLEKDKFAFRTPSLLNVEMTAPWSHAGAYTSLSAVIKHHLDPATAISNYDFNQLAQTGIQNLDKMASNTQAALDKLAADRAAGKTVIQNVSLSDVQIEQLVAFLNTLTDPCVKDRDCLAKWIPTPNEDPNGDQLDAVDNNGTAL